MKMLKFKTILKKQIISMCIVIMLFSSIFVNYAHADFGGVLIGPLVDFAALIGDTVLYLMQEAVLGNNGETDDTGLWGALEKVADDFVAVDGDSDAFKPFKEAPVDANNHPIETASIKVKDENMDKGWWGFKNYKYPVIYLSPAEIFEGRVEMFDIDFISSDDKPESRIPAEALHGGIARWYATLRNFALAGMLCVLIYIGIRIIISSSAKDSQKYKSLLTDWIVAMCLMFFVHYLILLLVTLSKQLTAIFAKAVSHTNIIKITMTKNDVADHSFYTNQLGYARFLLQYNNMWIRVAYLAIYMSLVGFTFYYSFVYIKRTLMMALLTLSAPVIVLMYPIDRFSDGQSQSFKTWFNELLYTCLLQPFHLILYSIFVGSATTLAMNNPIYSIVVLWFLIPAEKFFKEMLGFKKRAPDVGGSPAIAGALGGLAAGQVKKMLTGGKGGSKSKSGGKDGGGDGDDGSGGTSKPPRQNKNNTKPSDPSIQSKPVTRADYDKLKHNINPINIGAKVGAKVANAGQKALDKGKSLKEKYITGDDAVDNRIEAAKKYSGYNAAKSAAQKFSGKVKKFSKDYITGPDATDNRINAVRDAAALTSAYADDAGYFLYRKGIQAKDAIKKGGSKVLKNAPKTLAKVGKAVGPTVLRTGATIGGALVGGAVGLGYAAMKGDADPSQEILAFGGAGVLGGNKLVSRLSESAVSAGKSSAAKMNFNEEEFKKLGKQIAEGFQDVVDDMKLKPKIDIDNMESAINNSFGQGYKVDKMELQASMSKLESSNQLTGTEADYGKIVQQLQKDGVHLQDQGGGTVEIGAKLQAGTANSLVKELEQSLANSQFQIEKVSVADIDLNKVTSQLNTKLKDAGKVDLEVDSSSVRSALNNITFKPQADTTGVMKQVSSRLNNIDTKLKDN